MTRWRNTWAAAGEPAPPMAPECEGSRTAESARLPDRGNRESDGRRHCRSTVSIAGLALLLALLGIASRSPNALASFWPANAVILGIFVLHPRLARPLGWVSVLVAFIMADFLIAQTPATSSFILNTINLAGIAAGYLAFRSIFGAHIDFDQPFSIPRLCLVALAAAAAQGLLGGAFAAATSQQPPLTGALDWFSEGFLSYITLLPVVLGAPAFWRGERRGHWRRLSLRRAARAWQPMALLGASLAASLLIGGGGAIAFPVLALSYCALRYRFFVTAVVVVLFTVWATQAAALGLLPILASPMDVQGLVSLRLATASIALAPLIIASVMAAHARALAQWRFMADSDSLTATLNPRGFRREAQSLLRRLHADRQPVAALMMDLDFFKQINDTYGHSAGDSALVAASNLLRRGLRKGDVCGRLGGEEFGVLLAQPSIEQARVAAERIRASIEARAIPTPGAEPIQLTASIGVSFADPAPADLSSLLYSADQALYRAKRGGRNRVCAQRVEP